MWKLQTAIKGVVSYRIKSLNVLYCQAGSIMEPQPSLIFNSHPTNIKPFETGSEAGKLRLV